VQAARVAREQARAAAWEARRQETERRAAQRHAYQEHLASRQQRAEQLNADLTTRLAELEKVLVTALGRGWALDFELLKRPLELPGFDAQGTDQPAAQPRLEDFLPKPPGFFQRLIPGSERRHQQAVEAARHMFETKQAEHEAYEAQRVGWLEDAHRRHDEECKQRREEIEEQHAQVDSLRAGYLANDREAIMEYFLQVFDQESLPLGFPQNVAVTYDPEERLLLIERELPAVEVIPAVSAYRWYKGRDEIVEATRQAIQIKILYTELIARMALRTLHVIFAADTTNVVDVAILNGYVDVVNPATGQPDKPCLLTVRVRKDQFLGFDLSQVQPVLCLKHLRALVSRSPHELEPVEPILRFNMVDARFVKGQPILDRLDQRRNVATLTPYEFESLIRDLFEKMGHDTKQTRPSRDGGVDCVAFDTRPIVGGRVVIQAKRYRHVIGVGAVRDLYGTMQNERANKGILITTSHYTSAAREFAKNLPLELIDGAGLLSLLETKAGVDAKIDFPEGWTDPTNLASAE
jgi:restriction system protein